MATPPLAPQVPATAPDAANTGAMSVDDFAKRIKAKYPDYANVDNTELAQKIVAKHPEYAGKVDLSSAKSLSPAPLSLPALPVPAGLKPDLAHLHDTDPIAQNPNVRADMIAAGDLKKPGFVPQVIGKLLGASGGADDNYLERMSLATSPQEKAAIRAEKQKQYSTMSVPEIIGKELPVLGSHVATGEKAVKSFQQGRVSEGLGYTGGTLLPGVGPAAASAGEDFGSGDVQGGLSTLAAGAVPIGIAKILPAGPVSEAVPIRRAPLSSSEAVARLRTAVNPNATDAPGFIRNLTDQIDTIAAHKSGVAPGNLQELAQHLDSVAKADPYQPKILQPYAAQRVSPYGIKNYSGEMAQDGTTSIGALDKRLSTINKTLSPKYQRGPAGSVQQGAAVGAQEAVQLQAEAAGIRNTLAQELAKRTGLPAEKIAAMRRNYGQINDLRDTVQQYADEGTARANTASQQPPDLHTTVAGLAKGGAQKLIRAVQDRGNTPVSTDPLIRDTFQRYQRPPLAPPTITPPEPPTNYPGAPPSTPFVTAGTPAARGGGGAAHVVPKEIQDIIDSVAKRGGGDITPQDVVSLIKTGTGGTKPLANPAPRAALPTPPPFDREGFIRDVVKPAQAEAISATLPPEVQRAIFQEPEAAAIAKPDQSHPSGWLMPDGSLAPGNHAAIAEKALGNIDTALVDPVKEFGNQGAVRLVRGKNGSFDVEVRSRPTAQQLSSISRMKPGGKFNYEVGGKYTANGTLQSLQSAIDSAYPAPSPLEPRVRVIDTHGTEGRAPGTAGTVPLSQVPDALRQGHQLAEPSRSLADIVERTLRGKQ